MLGQMPNVRSYTGKQQFKTNKQKYLSVERSAVGLSPNACTLTQYSFFSHGVPPELACAVRKAALLRASLVDYQLLITSGVAI